MKHGRKDPLIGDKYRDREDVRIDIITTSRWSYIITWAPARPNLNVGQAIAKMHDLIKANPHVELEDYAAVIGVEIIHQAAHVVDSRSTPQPGDPSAFIRDFQMNLLRHNDTLEARDIYVNFKKSRPEDFDPVTLEPITQDGKQIDSNVQTILRSYRAGKV